MINKEKAFRMKPTLDRVLVERQKTAEEISQGGIILTHGVKHDEYKPNTAKGELIQQVDIEEDDTVFEVKIIAAGPDCKGVKKGDRGLINKYCGIDMFKDQSAILINEKDILAIL